MAEGRGSAMSVVSRVTRLLSTPPPTQMRSRPVTKCRQGGRGCLLGLPDHKAEEGTGIYTSKDVATMGDDESPWQVLFIHKELRLTFDR